MNSWFKIYIKHVPNKTFEKMNCILCNICYLSKHILVNVLDQINQFLIKYCYFHTLIQWLKTYFMLKLMKIHWIGLVLMNCVYRICIINITLKNALCNTIHYSFCSESENGTIFLEVLMRIVHKYYIILKIWKTLIFTR